MIFTIISLTPSSRNKSRLLLGVMVKCRAKSTAEGIILGADLVGQALLTQEATGSAGTASGAIQAASRAAGKVGKLLQQLQLIHSISSIY